MKCLVFILVVFLLDTGKCKIRKHDERNTVPKETTITYYTKPPNEITIPIFVHLDKALAKSLHKETKGKSKQKFKIIVKDVLKNVERLFAHLNIHQRIHFDLLDLKILKNKTDKYIMSENVSHYLKSYCRWQGERKMKMQKWYYSVLLTGLDLYYLNKNGGEVRSSTGRGYMKGICSKWHSCTLLEWHPISIVYILAHEFAHSLGISHDGPPYNECHGQRYIMNAKHNPRHQAKLWSPCNKRALNEFLKSKYAWCLRQDIFSNSTLEAKI